MRVLIYDIGYKCRDYVEDCLGSWFEEYNC